MDKIRNKRFASLLLSIIMTISIGGCAKTNNDIVDDITTNASTNKSSVHDDFEETKEAVQEEQTTVKQFYDDDENVYVTANVNLRSDSNTQSEIIDVIEEYNKLERIKTNGDWDYVSYGSKRGYVSSKYTNVLGDTYVEVDISEQTLYLYVDDDKVLTADVVTGKNNKYDTRIGCHPIYSKERNRYLKGNDYNVFVEYWLPFDKGQGLHDASWRSSFNKDDYFTTGSHGCVNMKKDDVKYVYDNVTVGKTLVLVHK